MPSRVLTLVVLAALTASGCLRGRGRLTSQPAGRQDPAITTTVILPEELSREQVRLVQRALGSLGFRVEPSGRFDRATREALARFQGTVDLPPTGNLNAETAQHLGLDPREIMPVRGETSPGTVQGHTTVGEPAPLDEVPGVTPWVNDFEDAGPPR